MPAFNYLKSALVLALLLMCCSCAYKGANTFVMAPEEAQTVCRVAVLPFNNESDDPSGGALVSNIFRNALIRAENFEVVGEGEVRSFLTRSRILPDNFVNAPLETYGILGKDLVVDAVVRGRVIDIGEKTLGREGVIPYLNLYLELVDVSTGRPIVSSFHRRRGDEFRTAMHFGVVRTRSELMAKVADEILGQWEKHGVRGCE